jgi:hypothetical protein
MDGHNLLNLKYEEAMDLFRSGGAEVEILLSQVNTDIGIFMSEEELCDTKAVRRLTRSDRLDSDKLCIPLIKDETGCGAMNLIPVVDPEPSCAVSVEDSYLNNIRFETAVEVVSGGEEFEIVSAPTAKQQLHVEKHPSPGHNSQGSIRAVCCVLRAEDG